MTDTLADCPTRLPSDEASSADNYWNLPYPRPKLESRPPHERVSLADHIGTFPPELFDGFEELVRELRSSPEARRFYQCD